MLIEDNSSVVYVLSNPSMPGLLKIGETSRNVEKRVAELNRSTSIPTDFVIERAYDVSNSRGVEKQLHLLFYDAKVGKEFFELDVQTIDQAMNYESSHGNDLILSYIGIQTLTLEAIERLTNFIILEGDKVGSSICLDVLCGSIDDIQKQLSEHLEHLHSNFEDLSDDEVNKYFSDCESFLENLSRFELITSSYPADIDQVYYSVVDDLLEEINEEVAVFMKTIKRLFELSSGELEEGILGMISTTIDASENFFEFSKKTKNLNLDSLHYKLKFYQCSNSHVNLYLSDYT
jgi:hypothetical protein